MGTGGIFLRKLRAKITEEPTGFVWVEKDKLAASGYPASRKQVEWLVSKGFASILTLTEDPLPKDWVLGLNLQHVPMQDHEVPTVQNLEEAVSFLVDQIDRGRIVLVHCLAGEGRTGCVLASYLISARGMSASEALKTIREIKPSFVERTQEKAIFEYSEGLKR